MNLTAKVRLAIALGVFTMTLPAQTMVLDPLVGRDLWKNPPTTEEKLRLDELIGKIPKGEMIEPQPWHVWKVKSGGQARYVVLLGESEMIVPGGSSACVQLFDANTKRINSWSFQTGWRISFDSASIEFSNDLASDLIVLHMFRFINGRDIAREYFAVRNDQLQFVRMENAKGEIVQNEYVYPNYEIGVIPDGITVEEWAAMLESKNNSDVLSALVFLGGRHLREPQRVFVGEPTESRYSGLFQVLIGSPRIREIIERLSRSENEWVRQAAQLAARGPRERLLQ
jgi:hypothetical protein